MTCNLIPAAFGPPVDTAASMRVGALVALATQLLYQLPVTATSMRVGTLVAMATQLLHQLPMTATE